MIKTLLCSVAIVLILLNVFLSFPLMGHDYSLVVSWANDYRTAWRDFGVFNIQFTPQRCLGVPVWANPIGANLSLFHLLSAFLPDMIAVIVQLSFYTVLGFFGVLKLCQLFQTPKNWSLYLAFAWCLQGSILMRSLVGHLPFVGVVLWPLSAFLLLRKHESSSRRIAAIITVGLILAHDFYAAATPVYIMFAPGFLIFLSILRFHREPLHYLNVLINFTCALLVSSLAILPKFLSIYDFTRNFPRETRFLDIGYLSGLTFSVTAQLLPPILDYKKMTGWWYGDWESSNYIFPGLVLLLFILSAMRPREYNKTFFSLIGIFLLAGFVASGVYRDFVAELPVVKSFHVNPRWLMTFSLAYLGVALCFFRHHRLSEKLVPVLVIYVAMLPFLVRDQKDQQLTYTYRQGYEASTNRVNYCYEPVFGYNLELFPHSKIVRGKMLDPRCYLIKGGCEKMTLEDPELRELLEYRLKPRD